MFYIFLTCVKYKQKASHLSIPINKNESHVLKRVLSPDHKNWIYEKCFEQEMLQSFTKSSKIIEIQLKNGKINYNNNKKDN